MLASYLQVSVQMSQHFFFASVSMQQYDKIALANRACMICLTAFDTKLQVAILLPVELHVETGFVPSLRKSP